jgi:hypothetical protein
MSFLTLLGLYYLVLVLEITTLLTRLYLISKKYKREFKKVFSKFDKIIERK